MGRSWALPADSERERVLLATAEVWSERGYDGLSVSGICSRAGIDETEFRALFPDVEAAAKAAIEVPLAAVVEVVAELYSPDRSEAESYAMAIVGILELMATNPAYADVVCITGRQMAPPGVHSLYKTGHQVLVAMLERLWENSSLSEKPAPAGQAALGGAEAVVRREIVAGRYERLPDLAPDFVYAATVPFLGIAEAQRLAQLACGHSRRGSEAR
jgi:AcrR family transcriptional regulator